MMVTNSSMRLKFTFLCFTFIILPLPFKISNSFNLFLIFSKFKLRISNTAIANKIFLI